MTVSTHSWHRTLAVATLLMVAVRAAERNWADLPETIDADRSMPLHTEAGAQFSEANSPWVEQVSAHPKAYVFHNFLSAAERAHIVRLAAPQMRRSSVVGSRGESVVDEIRTSYGMFIRRLQDPVIERIERRISLFTHLPLSHQEDIQVLRYTQGQKYGAHYDSAETSREAGPHFRLATFLMYLSDVEEGGETAFPHKSEWIDPAIPKKLEAAGVTFSECAKGHVAYKPKAGDATLFYSFHPNGTMDEASMHTGCPVVKGIKWAAPVWIHVDEYEPADFQRQVASSSAMRQVPEAIEPGLCQDTHKQCVQWAAGEECTRNKQFMVGDDGLGTGACRRACGACKSCAGTDIECINENRKKLGYLSLDRAEMEWLGLKWWFGVEPSPEL